MKKTTRLWIGAFCFLAVHLSAQPATKNIEYKGVRLGDSMENILKDVPNRRVFMTIPWKIGEREIGKQVVAKRDAPGEESRFENYHFIDGKLALLRTSVQPQAGANGPIVAKYATLYTSTLGKPTKTVPLTEWSTASYVVRIAPSRIPDPNGVVVAYIDSAHLATVDEWLSKRGSYD